MGLHGVVACLSRRIPEGIVTPIGRQNIMLKELKPYPHLKLYIAVRDDFPSNMVPTLVAHSMLSAHLIATANANFIYREWLLGSYRKVVIKVNEKEYNKILETCDVIHQGSESNTFEGRLSSIVVQPVFSDMVPNALKFAKLWKP